QFQQMQQQMNQMFAQATGGNTNASPLAGLAGMGGLPTGMGVDIQEKGNNYVVRAKVPAEATKNLKVAVDNDRVLKITAQNEDTAANQYQSSNFTQVFTLPGPVQSGKMKVENENGDVVITLPKA
ncbi:MAG TPA: Hsp20/alpha crystallin family protein, partial [Chthoniobacterales bacterium]|nr:Hsp20/alpha crystallin family protein [Chthoniobacterales bacterium]